MVTINKFYFHRGTTSDTGSLPGAGTVSAVLTAGTSASGASTNRTADQTIGASAQTSQATTTLAQTASQAGWLGRWCSAPIAAQTINLTGQTITHSMAASESNANSDFLVSLVLAVWRPGSGTRVGLLLDDSLGSTEPGTTQTALAPSTSGALGSVTAQDGDILVWEVWRSDHTQNMSVAYTNTYFYDGTTEASTTNVASFFNFSTAITMYTGKTATTTDAPTTADVVTRTGSFHKTTTDAPTIADVADAVVPGAAQVPYTKDRMIPLLAQ